MLHSRTNGPHAPSGGAGLLAGALGLLAATWLLAAAVLHPQRGGDGYLGVPAGTAPGQTVEFAGSESCRECHSEEYSQWAGSTHGTAGGEAGPETVIAPFGGPPIRFADALVTPLTDEDGRYVFVVERDGRPPERFVVSGVIGRGHMVGGGTQGFMARFEDGTDRFLPFDYSRDADAWFCNTAFVAGFWVPGADRAGLRADAGWLPVTGEMKLTECGDWPPVRILGTNRRFANCQNCHGSQVEVEYRPDMRRYETSYTTLRINCESCHGPARAHVEWAQGGGPAADVPGETAGGANPAGGEPAGGANAAAEPARDPDTRLAALDTLGTDASLAVCFRCHALKRAVGDGEGGGDYSLGLPLIGDSPYLPDGRIATFGYQQTHRSSACYLFGSMTCVDCHDPHSQGYRDVFGNPLEGRFDDAQCTGCHAAVAAEPERHTFHATGSPGAACTGCHMPYIQHPELTANIAYGRSDHTISIPRPGTDEQLGLESACARCHRDMSVSELAGQVAAWWGEVRPHRDEVAALIRAIAPGASAAVLDSALIAAAATGGRHGVAKLMAVEEWVRGWTARGGSRAEGTLADPAGTALAALAADVDDDVAAAATAALHATRGDVPEVRAFLDDILRTAPDPARLRVLWATALNQWAAAAERGHGPGTALSFLRRAQEVRPRAPETLVPLGAGLAATGDVAQAVQVYLEALRQRPDDPVALVNLGLGLEALGRADEAEAVYTRAVEARPTEALPHFNLGNLRFQRGDFEGAIAAYRDAVRRDPGLARAQFYLGVALINTGRLEEALAPLYTAREFAPGDEDIGRILRQLEAVSRRR